jgi:phosphotriesterase-related protein
VAELQLYAGGGGKSLVELSSRGLRWEGGDYPFGSTKYPEVLQQVSQLSGVQIVMGSSYYKKDWHGPLSVGQKTIEQIEQEIVNDLTVGVDGTSIRAGIIGEVGLTTPPSGQPLDGVEEKVLIASALAQVKTGVAMNVHVDINMPGSIREQVLTICEREGVDLNRVIVSHNTPQAGDIAYHRALMNRGAYVEFDLWGHGSVISPYPLPDYAAEAAHVKMLVDEGYARRILLSQDVYRKLHYVSRRGDKWGYTHILGHVLGRLSAAGVSQADLDEITTHNPRRVLPIQLGRPVLVGHWAGENNAQNSVSHHHGVEVGATYVPGRIGAAFNFNGSDQYVRIPHHEALNPSQPFSVSLWIKAPAQQPGINPHTGLPDPYTTVLDKSHGPDVFGDTINTGWTVQLIPGGRLHFALATGSGWAIATTGPAVTDDQWHHVAAVYTGRRIELYLDGKLQEGADVAAVPRGNSREMFIGRWWNANAPSRYFKGSVDELKIFRGALTENSLFLVGRA